MKLAGNAARSFATDHPLPETTQFIRQFQDDGAFHSALGSAAATAFRGRLGEARGYVIANRRGDWQPPMLDLLAVWQMRSSAEAWSAAEAFDALEIAQLFAKAVQAAAENIALQIGYDDRVPPRSTGRCTSPPPSPPRCDGPWCGSSATRSKSRPSAHG
jgi:hypothetical protein